MPNGTVISSSPNLRISLAANGNTLNLVITGTQFISTLPDGNTFVKATGRNLISVPAANGHSSGLFLTSGNVSFIVGPPPDTVEIERFSGPGKVVDICAALSA